MRAGATQIGAGRVPARALGGPPAWLRTCSPVSIVIAPSQMSKTLFFFACALCVVSAFVQTGTPLRAPAQKVPMARATAPGMMLEESDMLMSGLAAAGTLLATSNGDFGGYTIPVIGLALLAAIIGILAGPVEN